MTQVSTGGPYIAREVHEAALKVKDGIILELISRIERIEAENSIPGEVFNLIEKIRADVARMEAQLVQRHICKDGEVVEAPAEAPADEPRLKVDTVNNKLVPWSDELEQFFEPWSKLGLDGKIPMEPGEGYEFLPHGSVSEGGDEYWSLTDQNWCQSGERPGNKHSSPGRDLGPYRRRIEPAPPLVLEPSSSSRVIWYTRGHWTFRVCPVTGEHIRWTEDLETFFKPWMDLGVMDKVPLVPGEGYEFLPHRSPPEYGDEYWYISTGEDMDVASSWDTSCEKPDRQRVHSSPGPQIGPYRRKIKPAPPFETVPSGTTQTVLADPKTFLVESQQAYPLPKCPKCGNDPVWTTHNDLHRIGCSVCPDFGTSPTKSIKQVAEWWTKMCEPVAGESALRKLAPGDHSETLAATPATPTAAASAGSPVTRDTMPPEVGKQYLCRNGEITELVEYRPGVKYPFSAKVGPKGILRSWTEDGRHDVYMKGPRPYDLVAEYVKPRMKTVTLREYRRTGSPEYLWTTSDLIPESHYTNRTCECEVPE